MNKAKANYLTLVDRIIRSDISDPSHEAEFDDIDFYNNYFLKLIHNLAEENDVFAKWIMQFFAQMIQQPDQLQEELCVSLVHT